MKLHHILVVNNGLGDEAFGFHAVADYVTESTAMELAKKYIVDEFGEELYENIENDLEVLEYYAVDKVDGYRIKLIKEERK